MDQVTTRGLPIPDSLPVPVILVLSPTKGVKKKKGDELMSLNHNSKTVDVPASLPTPPHNTQEELR